MLGSIIIFILYVCYYGTCECQGSCQRPGCPCSAASEHPRTSSLVLQPRRTPAREREIAGSGSIVASPEASYPPLPIVLSPMRIAAGSLGLVPSGSLEGATMPNGQKFEEWLKSRGKGGENP